MADLIFTKCIVAIIAGISEVDAVSKKRQAVGGPVCVLYHIP